MLQGISGFFIDTIDNGGGSFVSFKFTADAPGQNIYANIALFNYNTIFASKNPNYTNGVAVAFVDSWTFYNPDGTESPPQDGMGFTQNAVFVENCASITFILFANAAWGIAQINTFSV